MSSWSIIGVIVAVLGVLIALFSQINTTIDKRIENAVNHPDFIKKVADEIRLPFLIFDANGTFQTVSGGATTFIEKIEPFKEENRFSGFIVYPKSFLTNAPILQSINSDIPFAKPKRVNTIDLQYRIPKFEGTVWANTGRYDEPPERLFKLEIIR